MQGPASHAAAQEWFLRRTVTQGCDSAAEVAALRTTSNLTISVCLPALNEQSTIGPICERIRTGLLERGLIDQLLVIDSGSTDETAAHAAAAGATVHSTAAILPDRSPILGKGEALWRSLVVAEGDLVVYLDSDVTNFDERFVLRLVEPLLRNDDVGFVKAFYERPLGSEAALGGGRVTELVARPLLNLFFPELSRFLQPLAGEYAARTELLRKLPFFCGYAVEIGLLIDVVDEIGLDGTAQVDLGERIHRNRATAALGPMAFEIMKAVLTRAETAGRVKLDRDPSRVFATFDGDAMRMMDVPLEQRPPLNSYPGAGSSGGGEGRVDGA